MAKGQADLSRRLSLQGEILLVLQLLFLHVSTLECVCTCICVHISMITCVHRHYRYIHIHLCTYIHCVIFIRTCSSAHQLFFPGKSWGGGREEKGGPFFSYTFVRHQGKRHLSKWEDGVSPFLEHSLRKTTKTKLGKETTEGSRENLSSGTFCSEGIFG